MASPESDLPKVRPTMTDRSLPPEEAEGYSELLSTISDAMRVITRVSALTEDLERLKSRVHKTFQARFKPAVPIEESVFPDHLICLIDGAKVKIMRRHLVKYGLNEDAYRFMFGLPLDYPMVPPAYSEERAEIARKSKMWAEVDHSAPRKRRSKQDGEPEEGEAEEAGLEAGAAGTTDGLPAKKRRRRKTA